MQDGWRLGLGVGADLLIRAPLPVREVALRYLKAQHCVGAATATPPATTSTPGAQT